MAVLGFPLSEIGFSTFRALFLDFVDTQAPNIAHFGTGTAEDHFHSSLLRKLYRRTQTTADDAPKKTARRQTNGATMFCGSLIIVWQKDQLQTVRHAGHIIILQLLPIPSEVLSLIIEQWWWQTEHHFCQCQVEWFRGSGAYLKYFVTGLLMLTTISFVM